MVRNNLRRADTVVVLDFETTGMSPNYGDRAIEIGADGYGEDAVEAVEVAKRLMQEKRGGMAQ